MTGRTPSARTLAVLGALTIAAILLGESPSALQLVGVAAVLSGVAMVSRPTRQPA